MKFIGGTELTQFAQDVLGRYTCNSLEEASGGGFAANEARPHNRPDARPFDVIVIGGGSFGPVLAQHLLHQDKTRSRRILVLDAGRTILPEHQQNLPLIGDLPVWETPWTADPSFRFAGLAMMLGGRSVLFGGWSPRLLNKHGHTELPQEKWPQQLVDELTEKDGYFDQAARQLGVDETNDFIFGALHRALRKRLAKAIDDGKIPAAVPLDELELHIEPPPKCSKALKRELRLEAPLAVQARPSRAGAFAYNKFSAVPLLMKAARAAQNESGNLLDDNNNSGDDAKKRLMVVPNFRVTRLETSGAPGSNVRVVRVHGKRMEEDGSLTPVSVPVGGNAVVAIGLATIESARLAMVSFPFVPSRSRMGANLMAHLRSNIVMRFERAALPAGLPRELQASAMLMKGVHAFGDGSRGYFHLQITAAGLMDRSQDDHAELFTRIPDVDGYEHFLEADDDHVAITIRGIGEMTSGNQASSVLLDASTYYETPRARVTIAPSAKDAELWNAMDEASNTVAQALADGHNFEIRRPDGSWKPVTPSDDLSAIDNLPYRYRDERPNPGRRDRLGTTHHEAGTLRLGPDPDNSVTDENARFHHVDNAFVAGPALFPTIGSPNPMLTGTAFARRLADHLAASLPKHVPQADPGFELLFDGKSLANWRQSRIHNIDGLEDGKDNPGPFIIADGTLESTHGTGLGMIWCTTPMPDDFLLRLEWLRWRHQDNSGVLLRFPDPRKQGYRNEAYVGVDFGYEVQIDELGAPHGLAKHQTGAIYDQDQQALNIQPARSAGEWNLFEIRVEGSPLQTYTVRLNGVQVSQFVNRDPSRGALTFPYIGLQSHFKARVAFRNIQFKKL